MPMQVQPILRYSPLEPTRFRIGVKPIGQSRRAVNDLTRESKCTADRRILLELLSLISQMSDRGTFSPTYSRALTNAAGELATTSERPCRYI